MPDGADLRGGRRRVSLTGGGCAADRGHDRGAVPPRNRIGRPQGWAGYRPDQQLTRVLDAESETLPYPEHASRRIWEGHSLAPSISCRAETPQGEPLPVARSATPGDQRPVGVGQDEEAFQLSLRRKGELAVGDCLGISLKDSTGIGLPSTTLRRGTPEGREPRSTTLRRGGFGGSADGVRRGRARR
ncbi:hypothetical protein GCM10027187_73380 [Streptosporangium sandarakinum]